MKRCVARAALVLIGASLFLTGCANVRLYNASNDAVAKKASDAVAAADLKSALVPERVAMQEFAIRELEAVKRDQYALRDRKVSAILSATTVQYGWDYLNGDISSRIGTIAGSPEASRAIEAAILRREDAAAKLPPLRQNYFIASKGRVGLSCPITAAQRPVAGSELEMALRPYQGACAAYQVAVRDLANAMGAGELALLTRQIGEFDAGRSQYETELAQAKTEYDDALTKSKIGSEQSKNATLAALKARFDAIDTLPKPSGFVGDRILLKLADGGKLEKLKLETKALEDVIQSFHGVVPARGATSAQERLAALRNLTDALSKSTPPPLTALILQAEHLRLEAAGMERHISRAKDRVTLLRSKQAAAFDELLFLNSAQRALTEFSGARCARTPSLYKTFLNSSSNCRFLLAQALSDYVNAATFGKAEQELIDYQLIAQGHEATLDDSETALAQTDNLMRVPASLLAKAYGGGIRPEEISNLVNALGLGSIAFRLK